MFVCVYMLCLERERERDRYIERFCRVKDHHNLLHITRAIEEQMCLRRVVRRVVPPKLVETIIFRCKMANQYCGDLRRLRQAVDSFRTGSGQTGSSQKCRLVLAADEVEVAEPEASPAREEAESPARRQRRGRQPGLLLLLSGTTLSKRYLSHAASFVLHRHRRRHRHRHRHRHTHRHRHRHCFVRA